MGRRAPAAVRVALGFRAAALCELALLPGWGATRTFIICAPRRPGLNSTVPANRTGHWESWVGSPCELLSSEVGKPWAPGCAVWLQLRLTAEVGSVAGRRLQLGLGLLQTVVKPGRLFRWGKGSWG